MDCDFSWDYYSLINELTQGMEHTKQLRTYLRSVASTSETTPELLLQKILSSYEQSLLILKWSGSQVQSRPALQPSAGAIKSMVSRDGSPRSDDKKRSFKDHQDLKQFSKRRKSQFTQQVRVSTESGFKGPVDDGYSWRKYGQKEILGAYFPRGYYRCTYHNVQNCWATKQVQRSDDDPTVFEIIYKGSHTCHLATNSALQVQMSDVDPTVFEITFKGSHTCRLATNSALQATSPEKQPSHHSLIGGGFSPYFVSAEGGFDSFEGPIDGGYSWRKFGQKDILGAKYPRNYYRCTYCNVQNCRAIKKVQRSDDDPTAFEIIYIGSHTCHLATNSALQATSTEKEASHHSLIVGGYSPSFVSPTTPESNYFSVSGCQMNDLGIVHNLDHSESYLSDTGIFLDLHHSDSDRTDTFSANTSTTSSSIGGEFARSSGARPDFSIWTKPHPQTEANTPQKDSEDE